MIVVDRCEVGYGCEVSDAGRSWPSSWSHVTCRTRLGADGASVIVVAEFRGGVENGLASWPESFPATIECTPVLGGAEQTYVVDLVDDPGRDGRPGGVHFETPIEPAEVDLTAGRRIIVDDRWITKAVALNLPDGDYSAPELGPAVDGSGASYPGVYCALKPGRSDDWLIALVMYGMTFDGTAYCVLAEGVTTHRVPLTIIVN